MIEQKYIDAIREYKILDEEWYLARYPDVKNENIDPFEHFIQHGIQERRLPNGACRINARGLKTDEENPVLNYIIQAYTMKGLPSQYTITDEAMHDLFNVANTLSLFDYDLYLEKILMPVYY